MPDFGASTDPATRFSLIVATVGRSDPLRRLLRSLEAQTLLPHEIVVVDQNRTIDLEPIIAASSLRDRIRHERRLAVRGVSQARNIGWRLASGDVLLFPDDDCWYPPGYLAQAARLMRETGAELLTGRAASQKGKTINGRFEARACAIDRNTAFTTQIEWNMCVAAPLLRRLGGYDEAISLGGGTPWQGGEGYDLVLRALDIGARCVYRPELVAHHDELPVTRPDGAMIAKGRAYGRGLGHVVRKHGFGARGAIYWVGRSLANLANSALTLRPDRARYFAMQLVGRFEGLTGRCLGGPATRQAIADVQLLDTR